MKYKIIADDEQGGRVDLQDLNATQAMEFIASCEEEAGKRLFMAEINQEEVSTP